MKLKEFDSSDWAKQLWLYALMLGKLGFEVKGFEKPCPSEGLVKNQNEARGWIP